MDFTAHPSHCLLDWITPSDAGARRRADRHLGFFRGRKDPKRTVPVVRAPATVRSAVDKAGSVIVPGRNPAWQIEKRASAFVHCYSLFRTASERGVANFAALERGEQAIRAEI